MTAHTIGNTFTYARVSSLDQNTDMQAQALTKAYPNGILRTEKASGSSMNDRPVLGLILEMINQGDKLVVWKLDRLARNMNDLTKIVATLDSRGASLEILDQKIDTSTASGKAFLQMLGVFAEFETNLRKERQLAGIQSAKLAGKHLGRRSILSDKQKAEIVDKRTRTIRPINPTELAKEYGVSRATIYNVLDEGSA